MNIYRPICNIFYLWFVCRSPHQLYPFVVSHERPSLFQLDEILFLKRSFHISSPVTMTIYSSCHSTCSSFNHTHTHLSCLFFLYRTDCSKGHYDQLLQPCTATLLHFESWHPHPDTHSANFLLLRQTAHKEMKGVGLSYCNTSLQTGHSLPCSAEPHTTSKPAGMCRLLQWKCTWCKNSSTSQLPWK